MSGVGSGEMGLAVTFFMILSFEALIFGSGASGGPAPLLIPPPQPISPSYSSSSCELPSPVFGCTYALPSSVTNPISSSFSGLDGVYNFLNTIAGTLYSFLNGFALILTYSAQYGGMLAWVNGIMITTILIVFIHGLV